MSDLAGNRFVLIISEDDYKKLICNGCLRGLQVKSKMLPDDTKLLNDENYKSLKKSYRKAMEDLNKYAFEKIINNPK